MGAYVHENESVCMFKQWLWCMGAVCERVEKFAVSSAEMRVYFARSDRASRAEGRSARCTPLLFAAQTHRSSAVLCVCVREQKIYSSDTRSQLIPLRIAEC
jgi:hypothetical protein